jgi:hypothetical protein
MALRRTTAGLGLALTLALAGCDASALGQPRADDGARPAAQNARWEFSAT